MLRLLRLLLILFGGFFRSRRDLLLENLALRQQLSVLRERRLVPQLPAPDKLFWVILHNRWKPAMKGKRHVQFPVAGHLRF